MDIRSALKNRALKVENFLATMFSGSTAPASLCEAMRYSLEAGGKRLRPVLCLSTARLCGLPTERALPFAAALECIHTYSLIHDDLPAMDDDALRRGKPSNHKVFGEALALLAGDALLTDAFAFMATVPDIPADRVLKALVHVARAAGSAGMVGGQVLDIAYTAQKNITLEDLQTMQAGKTGALLQSACVSGALLAGATEEQCAHIAAYGASFGVAFQIMDDILDLTADTATLGKPAGSDLTHDKATYPALLGIERSKTRAQEHVAQACAMLEIFNGEEAVFLHELAQYVVNREY